MRLSAVRPVVIAAWAGCLVLAAPAPAHAEPPTPLQPPLRLASDDWCPFICAVNGKLDGGYLVDLASQALAAGGAYQVEPTLMPLSRAMRDTLGGEIEGIYAPAIDRRLRLSVPLAYSRACFYTLASSHWTYQGLDALQGTVLGVIDDYGYDDGPMDAYVARYHGQSSRLAFAHGEMAGITNLQKLLRGRFEVILEHEAVLAQLGRRLYVGDQLRQAGCLEQALPLTIGFAAGDRRADAWLRALASGMKKLKGGELLKAMQRRYGIAPDGAPANTR